MFNFKKRYLFNKEPIECSIALINKDIDNPFKDLLNQLVLKAIFKKQITKTFDTFICENYQINYYNERLSSNERFYHKLLINQSYPKDIEDIKKIVKDTIKFANLKFDIHQIGFNYEFFIDDDLNIKNIFLRSEIANGINLLNITTVYNIDDAIDFNLEVANAEFREKKGIYIKANFHIEINNYEHLFFVLEQDFLPILYKKLDWLFKL